jgi:hypothetical protein
MPTGEDRRTYYTDGEPREFDEITAVVVGAPPYMFTPYVGEDVLVHMDNPMYPTVPPLAAQVARVVQVAGVADGRGSMLTFAVPLVIPRAPRLPRITVCDMDGNKIG